MSPEGDASMMRCRAGKIGSGSRFGLRLRPFHLREYQLAALEKPRETCGAPLGHTTLEQIADD